MCVPLIVQCHKAAHTVALDKHLVPCKNKGSKECVDGTAELEGFQVSPTTCLAMKTKEGEIGGDKCLKNLEQYGKQIHSANMKYLKGKKGGLFSWF